MAAAGLRQVNGAKKCENGSPKTVRNRHPKKCGNEQKVQKRSKTSENRRKSAKTIGVLLLIVFLPFSSGHIAVAIWVFPSVSGERLQWADGSCAGKTDNTLTFEAAFSCNAASSRGIVATTCVQALLLSFFLSLSLALSHSLSLSLSLSLPRSSSTSPKEGIGTPFETPDIYTMAHFTLVAALTWSLTTHTLRRAK